ncbi:hypothetical protein QTL95_26970 [Rhizobium sp. S152]|uniref:hypothetical protein n=1 Tax=Rhizobium sp. S152 TaxID=3055038 RepID=UPI0025A96289|nr:hypothetical protein [Rhizobium sp. S152]MDM9629531.1 hypothetical protein [Rhizobium sp. S152]
MGTITRIVRIKDGTAEAALRALVHDASLYADRPESVRDIVVSIKWEEGAMIAVGAWNSDVDDSTKMIAPLPHPSASPEERRAWAEAYANDVVGWRS